MKWSVGVLCASFLAIYAPDIGHGFIQDDFAWIRLSAVDNLAGLVGLFRENLGFYRPLVSTTFAFSQLNFDSFIRSSKSAVFRSNS